MIKRYNTLNNELKKEFGHKVMKLSLDGGFTCPNRDGTIGTNGCIFCSDEGSGEFTGSRFVSIEEQVEQQKILLSKKWKADKYIVYFQNFTNTYASVEKLRRLYYESIKIEGVVGLAIATRPDCLDDDILDLLSELNKETYLWIELGLQTIHEKSTKFIRRGYELSVYDEAIKNLKDRNIKVVTHIIIGLPNETNEDILKTVDYVAMTNTWGVKIHSLYIQKETDLHDFYIENPFSIRNMKEYIHIVADSIEILPKGMIIHRLTGDGKRSLLYEPQWTLDKLKVLTGIDKELETRNSRQGEKFNSL
jgi:radical SAM protein (TIGR01212 family)